MELIRNIHNDVYVPNGCKVSWSINKPSIGISGEIFKYDLIA